MHAGARPVFADIDPTTWNLDPAAAAAAVTPRTRAIIPVHYAGRPADMRAFEALARPRGLVLIEDAAHCVEGIDDGRKVGAIADFTCFSFYATKNLTTGEGGMVTTRATQAAAFMRIASLHGIDRDAWTRYAPGGKSHYTVQMAGFKYNMMDLQAAIGLHQLARIEAMHARRAAICARYDAGARRPPAAAPGAAGGRHRARASPLSSAGRSGDRRRDPRRSCRSGCARAVSSTSVHFRALHLQPYYQRALRVRARHVSPCRSVSDPTLSLPLHPRCRMRTSIGSSRRCMTPRCA